MTQHVRAGYRNHRRTTWAVALAVMAAVAAVAIPIALAATAATKYYTLTLAPNPVCSSTTDGQASTVVTLANTAGSQTLGSAQIYFPANSVSTVTLPSPSSWTLTPNVTSPQGYYSGKRDVLSRNNIGLATRSSTTITVYFKPNGPFTGQISATVKQANNFNDNVGSANLFTLDPSQGGFQTLNVVPCVTISGRVYQDRNLDNVYNTGSGPAFQLSDVPKAWNVQLYTKPVGAPASSYASAGTTTSSSTDGTYSFTQVPTGSDYKVCVTAAGDDASSKWALQSPTGSDCGPISSGGPSSSGGVLLGNLSTDEASPDTDFLVVPVVGPFGTGDTSSIDDGAYIVAAASNSTKTADDFYVQDTWTDSTGQVNFRFSPITPATGCTSTNCLYLLETLTADIKLSDLGGKQVLLRYDDAPPFTDAGLKPMPYCLIDPRLSGGGLATSGVLGTNFDSTPATSCIVEASQKVSLATGMVHTVFMVYTAYDGGRQIGF